MIAGTEDFQLYTGLRLRKSAVLTEVLEYVRFCGNRIQTDPFREYVCERYKVFCTFLRRAIDRPTDVSVKHIEDTGKFSVRNFKISLTVSFSTEQESHLSMYFDPFIFKPFTAFELGMSNIRLVDVCPSRAYQVLMSVMHAFSI